MSRFQPFSRKAALLSASFLISPFVALPALAQEGTVLPPVSVKTQAEQSTLEKPLNAVTLEDEAITPKRVQTSDSASLFSTVPGVSVNEGGGVSGLPAIHGLGTARVNLLVNGMHVGVACPNDMNSPLSYIDPSQVGTATVIAGITPVSAGGDSIAGTIILSSPEPRFSSSDAFDFSGKLSAFYRSNGDGLGGSISASAADDTFSLSYAGAYASSNNYEGGGDDGIVRSSEYQSENQQVSLAARADTNLFVLEVGQQYIPYEGYPNQYMDMLENSSDHINGRYEGAFAWGTIEARAYWQDVEHYMNFLADKGGTATGGMPMYTDSETIGYALKAVVFLSEQDTLRIGNEFVRMTLDDWWPAVSGSMMMGPNTYININDGERQRLGTYAEWERAWSSEWTTLLGVRNDIVWMDAGDVQPYSWMGMMNMADAMAASAFNAASHDKTDSNVDLTALVRFSPDARTAFELGYARKTRVPTLYERYAWGRGSMSSRMIGWFGDGNGYVGNLDLEPETANTVSATASWQGGGDSGLSFKITPYYTQIEDYIGVEKLQDFTDMMGMPTPFSQFQFVNHDAELYGIDVSGAVQLLSSPETGSLNLSFLASWVEGRDETVDTDLYHLMPLSGQVSLEYRIDRWTGTAEVQLVSEKSQVDTLRHEPETAAYALFNLRGSYSFENVRFDAGIENAFDTAYDLPLGGVSLGDYDATGDLRAVPGEGRSFTFGVTVRL
ncbi:MAG: TonB-dependent receptor plug domain-containing protein [Alphaproteobacteria bacterium]|nr:TonB-dependent receptor plug domain-containing protein [Alphaproteobacteria bacterium]